MVILIMVILTIIMVILTILIGAIHTRTLIHTHTLIRTPLITAMRTAEQIRPPAGKLMEHRFI